MLRFVRLDRWVSSHLRGRSLDRLHRNRGAFASAKARIAARARDGTERARGPRMRCSKIACFLGVTCMFLLAGCSADDGKPVTGPTGPGSGTGTGGGKNGNTSTTQQQPSDPSSQQTTSTTTNPTDPATSSAKKANAEACTANDQCESNVCFIGGNQSYCSVKCTSADAATTCVAPFTGTCNKQGFCKRD